MEQGKDVTITAKETFYALRASYGVPRRQAAQTLAGALNTPTFRLMERNRILDALARVQSANVDFGDAYLAASAAETSTPVLSFDRDLDKFPGVTRHQP